MDDMDQIAERHSVKTIDSSDPAAMTAILSQSLANSDGYNHLTSILHHIIIMPGDRRSRSKRLKVMDEVIQQIGIQVCNA